MQDHIWNNWKPWLGKCFIPSLYLAPSNYHKFSSLKNELDKVKIQRDGNYTSDILLLQTEVFYKKQTKKKNSIIQLVNHYKEVIDHDGTYVNVYILIKQFFFNIFLSWLNSDITYRMTWYN